MSIIDQARPNWWLQGLQGGLTQSQRRRMLAGASA